MALTDIFGDLHLLVRWFHVLAGIVWLGHLYFFNFVNVPLQAALDDAGKKAVNPHLLPRALWWFRWGAMLTFLFGLVLFTMVYMYAPGSGFGPSTAFREADGAIAARAWWIMFGMLLGTIMWFNVWFIIWPAQKKILSGKASPEELPAIRRRAYLTSRTNTYLSGPMLFGMLAPSHFGAIDLPTLLVAIAVAVAILHHFIMFSGKVGKSV
ncbi:MAG TPA: urate hydroxylase PuuD [Terriglobia bacterium]|nr:urate hydroxylase PuuD [Terriglobia bacterium]